MPVQAQKHPGTAAVLSFIFSGVGQLYNGQLCKGLVLIFCAAFSLCIFIAGSLLVGMYIVGRVVFAGQLLWGGVCMVAGLLLVCVTGIYSIVNAYKVAQEK